VASAAPQVATRKPRGPRAASPDTPQSRSGGRKRPLPWRVALLAGGFGVVIAALVAIYALQSGPGSPTPTAKGPRPPALLLVDRSGEVDRFPTLRAAMQKAIPGDHIIVREETWEETLQLTQDLLPGGNVWVEGRTAAGKPVRWAPGPGHAGGKPLLEVLGVSGVRFENFELDGQGKLDDLVVLSGLCPGLELGRLQLRGYRRAAVRTQNLVGLPNERKDDRKLITLAGLRTLPAEGAEALRFEAAPGQLTRHVLVRDGRFDGPAKAAIVFVGEAADVVIENCRVADVGVGVALLKREPVPPVHFTLSSSTFYDVATFLDLAAAPSPGKYGPAVVQNNLFVNAGALVRVAGGTPDKLDWLAGRVWNACDPDAPGGKLLGCMKVDATGLKLLPENDRLFLRYDRMSPLFRAAPGEKPAGAPPIE
jgi:hypothetical protein